MVDPDEINAARRALGRRLAHMRKDAGHTQHGLARLVQYGRSSIANTETGRQHPERPFWARCDQVLRTGGVLIAEYDRIADLNHRRLPRPAAGTSRHAADHGGEASTRTNGREQSVRVIWVNGAFGAGKTTLAQHLIADDPQLLLFDAELPGFMLRELVPLPPSGDFQDLRVWRRSVVDTAVALAQEYQRTLVVPMTVVVWPYLDEILTGLRAHGMDVTHYFITVPTNVIRRRIEAQSLWPQDPARDAQARTWRLAQVNRCAQAAQTLPAGTVTLDGTLPVEQLAARVTGAARS
ncbi:helix-turn-helix domain-containing protein [Micromonospora andamanensis]|uniref:helix-turn-helix domain-containing protein n=1 Tax=Micromonospora andamanensis TaxID=1287068 RepID=UPI001A4B905E|nr:helix-turn-helix domain-containing protein [Micromonospora andamanensis]GIJ42047.1 hypothetical protein Vwe01_53720 [Micromonospora andamanensis]